MQHIPIKAILSSDGSYIQYDNEGDAYFKSLSLKKCLEKMKTHIIEIIEELNSARSSWKTKMIVGMFFFNMMETIIYSILNN